MTAAMIELLRRWVPPVIIVAPGVLLAAPGCISLLPETEPNALYRLEFAPASEGVRSENAVPIVIDQIAAPRALSRARVVVVREGSVGYMARAAWISPAPMLVHNQIVDVFLAEVPQLAPVRGEDGVRARYRMQLELRHYEAIYDQDVMSAPMIHVRLQARLVDRETRRIIGLRQIHEEVRASGNRQGAIVTAFSQATNAVVRELAIWAVDEVNTNEIG